MHDARRYDAVARPPPCPPPRSPLALRAAVSRSPPRPHISPPRGGAAAEHGVHLGTPMATPPAAAAAAPVPCATGGSCGCTWGSAISGLGKQCMGLGAAPGGRVTAEECEAFCCHHSAFGLGGEFNPVDAAAGTKGGLCDLWQLIPVADIPDASYASNCFIGVVGTTYSCEKSQGSLEHVEWQGARQCLGLAPEGWGWPFVVVLSMAAGLYFGAGTVYRQRVGGAAGWKALPHAQAWGELRALVADGAAFARSGGRKGGGGGAAPAKERLRADVEAASPPKKKAKKAKKERHGGKEGKKGVGQPKEKHQRTAATLSASSAASGGGADEKKTTASGGGGRWVRLVTT